MSVWEEQSTDLPKIDLDQILLQEPSEVQQSDWSARFSNASSASQSNIQSPLHKPQPNQTAAILIDLMQSKEKKFTQEEEQVVESKVLDNQSNKSVQLLSVQSAPLVVFRQFFDKLQNERRNLCQEFDNMNNERQNMLKEMDQINRQMYELEMKKMQIQHHCSQMDQNQLVLHQQIKRVETTIKHLHHESNQFENKLFSKLFAQFREETSLPQLQPPFLSKKSLFNTHPSSTTFEEVKIEEEETNTESSSKKSKQKQQKNSQSSSTHKQFIFQQTTQQSFTFNHVHNCYILSQQQPFSSSSFDTSKESLYAYKSVLDFTILNDKLYAACTDASIKIFDLKQPSQPSNTSSYPNLFFTEWQCNDSKKWIKTVTHDSSLQQIISGGADGVIKIWDTTHFSQEKNSKEDWIEESEDEFWLDEAASLVQSKKQPSACLATISAHKSSVTDLICLDETKLVSCGVDQSIKLFDRNSLKWITPIASAHLNYVKTLHSCSGQLLSAGGDAWIRQWDLRNNKQVQSFGCFLNHSKENQSIHCVISNNNNQIIAGSRSGYLYQFDVRNASKMIQTIPIGSAIQALHWHPKQLNQIYYAAERSATMLLNLDTQLTLQKCNGHQANCTQLLVHDDHLYSSSLDSTIKVWNIF